MAKQYKERSPFVYFLMSNFHFDVNHKNWLIGDKSLVTFVTETIATEEERKKYANYHGVLDFYNKFVEASTYWHEQIVRAWMDALIDAFAYAKYCEAYATTTGDENVKFKAAVEAKTKFLAYVAGLE